MIIFPYRAQLKLHKWPVITIAISVLCLAVFIAQDRNLKTIQQTAYAHCSDRSNPPNKSITRSQSREIQLCTSSLLRIYLRPDPEAELKKTIDQIRTEGDAAEAGTFLDSYRSFSRAVPTFISADLWHARPSWNPARMLTSTIAHGSWDHVVFNLLVFFAFAASVELILGPVLFLLVFVGLALGIGSIDNFVSLMANDTRPTLGLSGVIMGMVALFAYFLPKAKIRFFYWFLLAFGTFGVPAWLVAAWYVGWDLYYSLMQAGGPVNFVAHLSGAVLGFTLGVTVFRRKRSWAKELVLERIDLTQDENWWTKFNFFTASIALLPVMFIVMLLVVGLVVWFVQSFWLQMLLLTPAVAAGWQMVRAKRAQRPDWQRYQDGVTALERREYEEALKHLQPLAEKGYPRAAYALGNYYATATGVARNEPKALKWFQVAATRGHPEAQYALGTWYADGRVVKKNPARAIEWYEKAATQGLGQAAMSLGYLFEHGVGVPADKEKAIEWYYRAGVAFKKAGLLDDTQTTVLILNNLAAQYPAVLHLVTKLKAIVAGTQAKN